MTTNHGDVYLAEVDAGRKKFLRDSERTLAETKLPEHPDFERASKLLIEAGREMANQS